MSRDDIEAKEIDRLEQFIKEPRRDHTYLIDGKRDEDQSTICRRTDANSTTTCLKLRMPSTKLFAEMQRLNFFCILPQGKEIEHKDSWYRLTDGNRHREDRDGMQ